MDEFGDDLLGPGEYIDFADARETVEESDGTAETRKADGWIRSFWEGWVRTNSREPKGGMGFMP